jgi:gas vesicle protein
MADQRGAGAGTILLAFLVGAAAGAAVALLYAPAAGRETRERLGEKAREGARRAGDAARTGRDVIEAIKDVYDEATSGEPV